MCSVDDATETAEHIHLDAGKEVSSTCMKCKVKSASVVIRGSDSFCRDCFLVYCSHKFRSSFGKSKVIRDGECVLVAYSGGIASSAMLHLVQEGKSCRAQKKLRFNPYIAFVDEGAALGLTTVERTTQNEVILKHMSATGYPCHIVPLEQVMRHTAGADNNTHHTFDVNFARTKDFEHYSHERSMLQALIEGASSLTAKEYLLKTLRNKLLSAVAVQLGCTKVITADTCTRISVNILSGIALGKGAHIPFDTALIDSRNEEVIVVRPMREFTAKEAAMYNVFHGVESSCMPNFTTMGDANSSIERLTEAFVVGLQSQFPATVSTVVRTGDKLVDVASANKIPGAVGNCQPDKSHEQSAEAATNGMNDLTVDGHHVCTLCEAPADNVEVPMDAHKYAVTVDDAPRDMCLEKLEPRLCYACQRTTSDMTSLHLLRQYIFRSSVN